MRLRFTLSAAALAVVSLLATPVWAQHFSFSTGSPNGALAALTQPSGAGKAETEAADDFALTQTTAISSATIFGLLPSGTQFSDITDVEVELYNVFPLDSDVSRTSGPPTFGTSGVPARLNSPADVEIAGATRDGNDGTLNFAASLLAASFTANNSVISGINKVPNQTTHGEGSKTGEEVAITINFTTPIILAAGHYFFRPEVGVAGTGMFLYLSGQRPTVPPFTPDLQAWIRNSGLKPDWLRIGTDIIAIITPPATTATTFNMAFALEGEAIPAGTPGKANCHGKTTSALAHEFGGMSHASLVLGASSVGTLQDAIKLFCN